MLGPVIRAQRFLWSSTLLAAALLACGPGGADDGDDEAASTSDASGTTDTGDETGTGTTTTTTTGTETGVDTIPLPDMEGGGGNQPCNPWLQDCPEGEKCSPYDSNGDDSWDDHKCVPIAGDGQPGDPCVFAGVVEATDDCGAGSYCWSVQDIDGQLIGVCTPYCAGTPDEPQCPADYSCLLAGVLSLCTYDCDPLAQDCPGELGCYWANTNFECIPPGELGPGEPCSILNECATPALCAVDEFLPDCAGDGCCTPYCGLDELVDPCPDLLPGTICEPFFEQGMAPPGDENVGVCLSLP